MAVVCYALQAYALVIFARIVLEWIPVSFDHPVARIRSAFRRITEPVLRPMRAMIPPVQLGGAALDLSPLIVLLAISILAGAIC